MPVYNEAGCIADVCEEWLEVAARHTGFKLLVVDDGSSDDTGRILRRISERNTALTVIAQKNGGHGAAVRRAYLAAAQSGAKWIFQIDSDRQFIPGDFDSLWNCRTISNFILGDRVKRNDDPLRVFLSRVHRILLLAMFGLSVKDPNIPFRLMRGSLLAELLPSVPVNAFAPNVLLSLLACKAGEDLLHVPVTHRCRTTGTVSINGPNILKIGAKWAVELLRFRLNGFASFRGRARERASTAGLV
jgi:glycosyltransferase involved in cell wall biosynthesis